MIYKKMKKFGFLHLLIFHTIVSFRDTQKVQKYKDQLVNENFSRTIQTMNVVF